MKIRWIYSSGCKQRGIYQNIVQSFCYVYFIHWSSPFSESKPFVCHRNLSVAEFLNCSLHYEYLYYQIMSLRHRMQLEMYDMQYKYDKKCH